MPQFAFPDWGPYESNAIEFDLPESISPDNFAVCTEHGCNKRIPIQLSPAQWQAIKQSFLPLARSAEQERTQIAVAVGKMEKMVAPYAKTLNEKGGDFNGFGAPGSQQDCIDESVNTTTYLTLFEQTGLLNFHRVEKRASRGYLFIAGWPHFTAIIQTIDLSKESWAVDSWFHDNGIQPEILPLPRWKEGWKPAEFSM